MNEAQIMDKLRTVVSPEDPGQLYSKIKKVGQGYVFCPFHTSPIISTSDTGCRTTPVMGPRTQHNRLSPGRCQELIR